MPKPIPINKDIINRLYHTENLKIHEVANRLGVCKDTIRRNMRLCGIPPKTPAIYRKGQGNRIISMLPRAKELYYDKELSFGETYQQLGISFYTLKRLFDDNGLKLRSSGEAIKLAYRKYPQMGFKKGDMHPRYNGYRTYETRTGYIRVYNPNHLRSGVNGYIGEHILVWEDTHHKPLPKGWIVHHLNGIKNDNRPENLAGLSTRAHSLVLAEKAKRIKFLEDKVRKLDDNLSPFSS
ncbi:hypothetical protein LCGC14_0535410 [marine sediment metagenome]|uniref:HNH nuclease domain-containing protein n=1 Tax=marine sediment metagenome TaxID=412755 RepID=A0A0F9SCP6_9ZZZZ